MSHYWATHEISGGKIMAEAEGCSLIRGVTTTSNSPIWIVHTPEGEVFRFASRATACITFPCFTRK